jgi:hypothetical protein
MNLPYNTGKVSIGSRFEPVKPHRSTIEEDFWQAVLTRKGKRRINANVLMTLYVAAFLVGYAAVLWVTR